MKLAIALLLLCMTIVACSADGPVCAAPYTQFGKTCCLDKLGNGICDKDEGLMVFNTSTVPEYKYVCPDGVVTDHPTKCTPVVTGLVVRPVEPTVSDPVIIPAPSSTPSPNYELPSTTFEPSLPVVKKDVTFDPYEEHDTAYINRFDVAPVCRGSFNAAELFFDLSKVPDRIDIEVLDDPDGRFRNVGSAVTGRESYFYLGFCTDCNHMVDASLEQGKYLVHGALIYGDRTVYTKEYVIDSADAGYTKTCY